MSGDSETLARIATALEAIVDAVQKLANPLMMFDPSKGEGVRRMQSAANEAHAAVPYVPHLRNALEQAGANAFQRAIATAHAVPAKPKYNPLDPLSPQDMAEIRVSFPTPDAPRNSFDPSGWGV